MERFFILALGIALMGITCNSCTEKNIHQTIYLVRHAEKDTTFKGDNPPLIMKGLERAQLLQQIMDSVKLSAVYSTKYERNLSTVQPILDAQQLELNIYEWHNWQAELDEILSSNGQFLICGHGDNLLPMIEYLGGDKPVDNLGHNEYDNLFKVDRTNNKVKVEVINF